MNTKTLRLVRAALWLGLAASSVQAGVLERLLGLRDIEVITCTDLFKAGRQWPAATQTQPQYYVLRNMGYHSIGGMDTSVHRPANDQVLRLITSELAKQGYLPATATSPQPTLALLVTWGTLSADIDVTEDMDMPRRVTNRAEISRFIGGYKIGLDRNFYDPLTAPVTGLQTLSYEAQSLYSIADQDFYIAVVTAYDLDALRHKQKVALWSTRIACPAIGFSMAEVLPSMISIGGPNFGRETKKPVWICATKHYQPDIKVGEMKLVEYLGKNPLPIIDNTAKGSAPAKPAQPVRVNITN